MGDGISYNTEISKVEKEDDENVGLWLRARAKITPELSPRLSRGE